MTVDDFSLYEWSPSGMIPVAKKTVYPSDRAMNIYIKLVHTAGMQSEFYNAGFKSGYTSGIELKAADYRIAKQNLMDQHGIEIKELLTSIGWRDNKIQRLEIKVDKLKNELSNLMEKTDNVE